MVGVSELIVLLLFAAPEAAPWAQVLLDGFVGALVGGAVAAGVAILVVNRQHRFDNRIVREQHAIEKAEELADAIFTLRDTLTSCAGRFDVSAEKQRSGACEQWIRAATVKGGALSGNDQLSRALHDSIEVVGSYQMYVKELRKRGVQDSYGAIVFDDDVKQANAEAVRLLGNFFATVSDMLTARGLGQTPRPAPSRPQFGDNA